jgi:trimeric autotransporter adhesin
MKILSVRNLALPNKHLVKRASLLLASLLISAVPLLPQTAHADTVPNSTTSPTVSADPLPTAQIDGIVWRQAIVGNKVYATGRFTTARPAGVPKGGAGTVTRMNLIAYDITTGLMDNSFVHSLTGTDLGGQTEGKAITASPDGKRLYVGGTFTAVDGQPRKHFAAFDLTTNSLLPGFDGTNGIINAVAATNTQVFIGGSFTTAANAAHVRIASYSSTGAINSKWVSSVNGNVAALLVTPAQGNLIVGGSFSLLNGHPYNSTGALKLSNGWSTPWASQSSTYPIRMQPPAGSSPSALGITSLSTDGTQIYLTAFTYLPGIKHPGSFEGRAAVNIANGNLIWANDCAGDSYDAFPVGKVLYSVSHAHNCSPIGGFGSGDYHHALAETTYKASVNGPGMGGNYPSFQGIPRGGLYLWFPDMGIANVSGAWQAAWSVVGNANYIALGGEFPTVQGVAQQGLVRYGLKAYAPNKIGPKAFNGYGIDVQRADSTGKSVITMRNTSDPDNAYLTYYLYRGTSTTPIFSKTVSSLFWKKTLWTFTDTGVPAGSMYSYRMVAKDPFGNTSPVTNSLIDDTDKSVVYSGSSWVSAQTRPASYNDFHTGIHYTTANGSSATFTVYGTNFAVITEKYTDRGTFSVKIDGVAAGTASAYSTDLLFQQNVYQKTGLSNGKHTVTITKVDGTNMALDGILVLP